jgi:hypothetical protein
MTGADVAPEGVDDAPLVPLSPIIEVEPPCVLDVWPYAATFGVEPGDGAAQVQLPAASGLQAELQSRVQYTLCYELQLALLALGPPDEQQGVQQLLEAAPNMAGKATWRVAASFTQPPQEAIEVCLFHSLCLPASASLSGVYCCTGASLDQQPEVLVAVALLLCPQVTDLRPGRFYVARLVVTATATVSPKDTNADVTAELPSQQQPQQDGQEEEGQQLQPMVVKLPPVISSIVTLRTVPTAPAQMPAPALSQRARNALKVSMAFMRTSATECAISPAATSTTAAVAAAVDTADTVAYRLWMQLKWGVPDETGGERVLRYELLLAPLPPAWDGNPPNETVREAGICVCVCVCVCMCMCSVGVGTAAQQYSGASRQQRPALPEPPVPPPFEASSTNTHHVCTNHSPRALRCCTRATKPVTG